MAPAKEYSLESIVRQSPPIDTNQAVDDSWVKGKTIVITGGASGLGAAFFRAWATAGANVIIGDVNVQKGDQLVRDVRIKTGNSNLHFLHCDVIDWQSQVQFFKDAVRLSPHKGIDTVVANAGIVDPDPTLESPKDLDAPSPPPPNLAVIDVNLKGVLYTTHLALFYLPRNPGSSPMSPDCDPTRTARDRHLLLISSMAGLLQLTGQTLYTTSKHAVVGLYRSLRSTGFAHGVRVNMLLPYFLDTPLLSTKARMLLAGNTLGNPEDAVDAATRFVANPRICGRALYVGPKLNVAQNVEGEWGLVEQGCGSGEQKAVLEVYAHDFEDSEHFSRNIVKILNRAIEVKGWTGWFKDMAAAIIHSWGRSS